MEKKVRIGMDKWFVIGKFVILVLFTASVFWVSHNRGMDPFFEMALFVGGCSFHMGKCILGRLYRK